MLCILPTSFSQVFESVTMSYVLPVAQCDLKLTLEAKGMLNAITFAGRLIYYDCNLKRIKRINYYVVDKKLVNRMLYCYKT